VNAILNYAYSVAAAQITRSLQAAGFDSMAGFMHADDNGRHSLSYDCSAFFGCIANRIQE
jgi:CRISPR/Cas system-associated endonuclease Cas1